VGARDIDPIHVRELSRLEVSDSILSTVTSVRLQVDISQGLALVRNESKVSAGDDVKRCKFEEPSDAM
jgi:hypothetical protein